MKNNNIEAKLIKRYLETEFPKQRIKFKSSKKRGTFKKGIIVSHTLTNNDDLKYPIHDKNNREILFMILFNILKDVFAGIEHSVIMTVMYDYLDIT
jgi:hypothetical protein